VAVVSRVIDFAAARARLEAQVAGVVALEIPARRIPAAPAVPFFEVALPTPTLVERYRRSLGEDGLAELMHVVLEESR